MLSKSIQLRRDLSYILEEKTKSQYKTWKLKIFKFPDTGVREEYMLIGYKLLMHCFLVLEVLLSYSEALNLYYNKPLSLVIVLHKVRPKSSQE